MHGQVRVIHVGLSKPQHGQVRVTHVGLSSPNTSVSNGCVCHLLVAEMGVAQFVHSLETQSTETASDWALSFWSPRERFLGCVLTYAHKRAYLRLCCKALQGPIESFTHIPLVVWRTYALRYGMYRVWVRAWGAHMGGTQLRGMRAWVWVRTWGAHMGGTTLRDCARHTGVICSQYGYGCVLVRLSVCFVIEGGAMVWCPGMANGGTKVLLALVSLSIRDPI